MASERNIELIRAFELAVYARVGSALVHMEEYLETGHPADRAALESLLQDAGVQGWLQVLREMSILPVKRSEPVKDPLAGQKTIWNNAGAPDMTKRRKR